MSGTYHSIYKCGHALQSLGFHILNDISWFKPNGSPNLSCRYFTASHETLIWAKREKAAKHTFNYPDMKNGDWDGDVLEKPGRLMRSVWSILKPRKGGKIYGKWEKRRAKEKIKRAKRAKALGAQ